MQRRFAFILSMSRASWKRSRRIEVQTLRCAAILTSPGASASEDKRLRRRVEVFAFFCPAGALRAHSQGCNIRVRWASAIKVGWGGVEDGAVLKSAMKSYPCSSHLRPPCARRFRRARQPAVARSRSRPRRRWQGDRLRDQTVNQPTTNAATKPAGNQHRALNPKRI